MVASWILLWFFDSFFHWLWHCGMVSWALTVTLAPVFVALFFRAVEGISGRAGQTDAAFLGTGCADGRLPRPGASLRRSSRGPSSPLDLPSRSKRPPSGRPSLLRGDGAPRRLGKPPSGCCPALQWMHYLLPVDTFLRPNPFYLLSDFLDLNFDHEQTGMPVRTIAAFFSAEPGSVRVFSHAPDGRPAIRTDLLRLCHPLRARLSGRVGAAAQGNTALPADRTGDPVRHHSRGVGLPRPLRSPPLGAGIPACSGPGRRGPCFVGSTFRPNCTSFISRSRFPYYASFENSGMPLPLPMKLHYPPEEAHAVREYLEHALADRPGRVVIEDYTLSEYLAATSDLPILGGIRQRPVPHADAHLFRLQKKATFLPNNLPPTSSVSPCGTWSSGISDANWRGTDISLLRLVRTEGPFRIYETSGEPSFFLRGEGRIVRQKLNSIEVDSARGDHRDGRPRPPFSLGRDPRLQTRLPRRARRDHWRAGRFHPGCGPAPSF